MPKQPQFKEPNCFNPSPDDALGGVVTLSEACLIFAKSRTAIKHQIERENIKARQSITGGEYLISFKSINALYPIVRTEYLWLLK